MSESLHNNNSNNTANNNNSYIALHPVNIYELAALYIIDFKIYLTIKKNIKNGLTCLIILIDAACL